jgi:hypothetical protein
MLTPDLGLPVSAWVAEAKHGLETTQLPLNPVREHAVHKEIRYIPRCIGNRFTQQKALVRQQMAKSGAGWGS